MERLALPETDLQIADDLRAARNAYDDAAGALGDAELRAAAAIIRQLWGEDAARLLVDKDTNDYGDNTITPLLVLDGDDQPMWFASGCVIDYPGSDVISDAHGLPLVTMSSDVLDALANHLEAAYDAFGGCGGALHVDPDEYLPELNVLGLDIHHALAPV